MNSWGSLFPRRHRPTGCWIAETVDSDEWWALAHGEWDSGCVNTSGSFFSGLLNGNYGDCFFLYVRNGC